MYTSGLLLGLNPDPGHSVKKQGAIVGFTNMSA